MGKKSSGSTPHIARNTAKSSQILRMAHAISEGEVEGPANGDLLKSIYINDTPVQEADGKTNFNGIDAAFLSGTEDQSYVPGFDFTERVFGVSTQVKNGKPISRTVTDPLVDHLRVTLGVNQNSVTDDKGNVNPTRTVMSVQLVRGSTVHMSREVVFTEKSGGQYLVDEIFEKLPPTPFTVKVSRVTQDYDDNRTVNDTYFQSYSERISVKLSYPHTAILYIKADSEQFGNSSPRVNLLLKGLKIRVPSNYDPVARTYSGIWDGQFKVAWSNNPAWVMYDILTAKRYSGIAKRLQPQDIDKWSLYDIGRYCDQMVDDGFGGREPRFVCNAYITDERSAFEVLNDLASCFRGLVAWRGNTVGATLDRHSDPVATYTNSNVVDGVFTYETVARKAVHTAVQVKYVDKNDGYRTNIEALSDDSLVQRFGYNAKSITAFGCDSRGQAHRLAKWLLYTEANQRETVSFSVGREGLRCLPHDIFRVVDNDRIGARSAGRVSSVSGSTLNLAEDWDTNTVLEQGGTLLYRNTSGGMSEVKVRALNGKRGITLMQPVRDIAEDAEWVYLGKIKPTYYRCIGIKENSKDGTYAIKALIHDPNKEQAVEQGIVFENSPRTLHTVQPEVGYAQAKTENGKLKLSWDSSVLQGEVASYNIEVYRNDETVPMYDTKGLASPEITLENLPPARYTFKIYAVTHRGRISQPYVYSRTIDYSIANLKATPKLLGIELSWTLPDTSAALLNTEIWYGTTNNLGQATRLVSLAAPQNLYTLTSVRVHESFYFWVRIRDVNGNTGEFTTPVRGTSDPNPAPLVKMIERQITESSLSQSLKDLLDGKIEAGKNAALAEAGKKTAAEAAARAKAIADEAAARRQALEGEAEARSRDIRTAAKTAADGLAAKARELGTKITAVEDVGKEHARKIETVTAAQGKTAAGLEREIEARANGINAEARKRETMVARLDGQIAGINREQEALAEKDRARARETTALTARLDTLKVGGRNLLKQSAPDKDYGYGTRFKLTEAPAVGEDITVTLWGEPGADRTGIGVFNSRGWGEMFRLAKVSDGLWRGTGKWKHATGGNNAGNEADDTHLNVYFYPNTATAENRVTRIKLERGTLGTDWTPAPEDTDSTLAQMAADITREAKAYADERTAGTVSQTEMTSKLKTAAEKARDEAVAAAKTDAQKKADAARQAAEEAAQKKADAAKAQAVADASGDATAKANAAQKAAEADAAQKAAEVKKQAADDAKAKADKALADAKAYADGLNEGIAAKITRLEQTTVTRQQAEAIVQSTVSAKFQTPDTRNDNQPPSWYWENYPRQTVTEFKKSSVIGLRGGVGSNAFCAMETRVPFTNPTGGKSFRRPLCPTVLCGDASLTWFIRTRRKLTPETSGRTGCRTRPLTGRRPRPTQ